MRAHLRITTATLTLLAALFLPAPASAAPGIALAWDHCLSQGTGTQNKVFACDTNVGSSVMVGTFELVSTLENVSGAEIIIQLATASAALPAWWDLFNSGACRQNGLSANNEVDPADLTCPDWGEGQMLAFLAGYCTLSSGTCVDHPTVANQARIKLVEAVPSQFVKTLSGAQPYFAFNLVLNRQRTVGTGSCAGCDVPVCIVLNSIKVTTSDFMDRFISNASAPGGNFVTWQGGGPGCPGATPTRNSTWGSVKSLYR
jgi:hypothetical protein